MEKRTSKLLYPGLALIILLFHSCASTYVPNVTNVPLFTNKGELQASVNTGVSGFDPQLAFALTDHIGLMANASFANQTSDSTDNFHKHQYAELGAGYFIPFMNNTSFEVYGGFGYGKTQGQMEGIWWVSEADANLIRASIQPTFGFTSKFADGGLAVRGVMVNIAQPDHGSTGFYIEPVLTARLGYKNVKLMLQGGLSIPLNADQTDFESQLILLSIGLHVNLWKD